MARLFGSEKGLPVIVLKSKINPIISKVFAVMRLRGMLVQNLNKSYFNMNKMDPIIGDMDMDILHRLSIHKFQQMIS